MVAPKTGSRRIVVDDVARWRPRRRATVLQADYGCGKLHVSVELFRRPGAVLLLFTDRPHPADWATREVVPVCPVDIADWVRLAVEVPGPQFVCSRGGDRSASFFLRRADRSYAS